MIHAMTTLAASEWIVAVIAIGMVVSGIINSNKQAKEAKEARERRRRERRDSEASVGGDSSSNLPTLDEIAAQRREQLESLSRQRRSASRPPAPRAESREPERVEVQDDHDARADELRRERANAAAEQRRAEQRAQQAEELRQRNEQAKRDRAARAQRKQQQLQQQQERQRQAQAQRQAAAQQPSRSLGTLQPTLSGSLVSSDLGRGASNADTVHVDDGSVHRHVTDVPMLPSKQIGHGSEIRNMIKGHALRNAILLKEVLDPPVGMRDPDQKSDPFSG